MSDFNILIDSSTIPTSKTNKYGKSIAFWIAFWGSPQWAPCRAGFIYHRNAGPHKVFFDGIIRALQDCKDQFCVTKNNTVKIKGDDLTVIRILNQENNAHDLKQYHEQVIEIECNCISKHGVKFEHEYLGEKDTTYRVVDKIAKELNRIFSGAAEIDDILEELRKNN